MNMLTKVANAIASSQKASGGTYLDDARAAIEAMEEPTQPMREAAFRRGGVNSTQSYKAAILAALEDKA